MTKTEQALPAPISLTFEQARQVTGGALIASLVKYAGPMPPALFNPAVLAVSAVAVRAI